jgi:exodeoxyribonuclease III
VVLLLNPLYTGWSNLYNGMAKNLGWRIDYFMASSAMKEKLNRAVILKDAVHSDHCPVLLEIA